MNAAHAKKIMTQKIIPKSIYNGMFGDQCCSMHLSLTRKLHR